MSLYCSIPECDKHAFINGMCYTHDKDKKREEKAKLKVKKVYVIPKRSEKKKKEDVEYSKLRKDQLTEHPECQIKIKDICERVAIEVHHPGKRGKNYLKKELFMSACRPCHVHVETVMSAKERRNKNLLI